MEDGLIYVAEQSYDPLNDFGESLNEIGDFVVDDIGGAFTDAYDWASNEGNWAALGKTLLEGTKLVFEGDFDGAAEMWGNDEHYTEEFWKELEDEGCFGDD